MEMYMPKKEVAVEPTKIDSTTPEVTPVVVTPKKRKPRKRGIYYIDRAELLQDVIDSKAAGKGMNDRLAAKLTLLTTKYARSSNFSGYTYNDDMQGYAKMMLVKSWGSFNPEKSDNPFAFYTQCIKNSFKQFLNMEKRHRNLRDALLVDKGMNPSYAYENEYRERMSAQSESDLL